MKLSRFRGYLIYLLSVFYIFSLVFLNTLNAQKSNPAAHETQTEHELDLVSTQELFSDLKKYDTSMRDCHWGNVYQHNVWVARSIALFFDNPIHRPDFFQWVSGINPKYKKFLILTGFLHDIGKAGDLVYNFITKEHQNVGHDYLMGAKPYKLSPTKTFDLREWVRKFGFNDNDITLMAILIRMHHRFGDLLTSGINTEQYINTLQAYFNITHFNGGVVTEEFLNMCVLLSAADVYGMSPVDTLPGIGLWFPQWQEVIPPAHPTDGHAIKYNDWGYATKGIALRAQLIKKFQELHPTELNKLTVLKESLKMLKIKLNLLAQQLQKLKKGEPLHGRESHEREKHPSAEI